MVGCVAKTTPQEEQAARLLLGLDTGAELNVMSIKALSQVFHLAARSDGFRLVRLDRPIAVNMANRSGLKATHLVTKLPVRVKHVIFRIDAIITNFLSRDILLGRPFLAEYGCTYKEGDLPTLTASVPKKGP
jgi:hypothetical protein